MTLLQKEISFNEKLLLIALCAEASITFGLCLFDYPVVGGDAHVHFSWLHQYLAAFDHGNAYPRWLPESLSGLGLPVFYFYMPLSYFVLGMMHTIIPWIRENQLLNFYHLLSLVLASLTMWFFLRRRGIHSTAALLSSLFYSFNAYRLTDFFITGAFAEHLAVAFLPLLFIEWKHKSLLQPGLIVVWSLLILSNLAVFFIGTICVALLTIASSERWERLKTQVIAVSAALLLTSFYLVPLLTLRQYTRSEFLLQLLATIPIRHWGFALYGVFATNHSNFFALPAVMIVAGVLLISITYRSGSIERGWLALLILAVMLQIPFIAEPLWQNFFLLQLIQTPFRWCIGISLSIAVIFTQLESRLRSFTTWVILTLTLFTLVKSYHMIREGFNAQVLDVRAGLQYGGLDYIPKGGTFNSWAIADSAFAHRNDPEVMLARGNGRLFNIERSAKLTMCTADLATPSVLLFHRSAWPYWLLTVDGTPAHWKSDSLSRIVAIVPAGRHHLQLYLEKTEDETMGWLLSSVTLIGLVVASQLSARKRKNSLNL